MPLTMKGLAVMDNLIRPANNRKRIRAVLPRYLELAGHGATNRVLFARDPFEMMRLYKHHGGHARFHTNAPKIRCGDTELLSEARLMPAKMELCIEFTENMIDDMSFLGLLLEGDHNITLGAHERMLIEYINRHHDAVMFGELERALTGTTDFPPILELYDAGVFSYLYSNALTICLLRPKIYLVNGRLHRPDGPAIEWPSGRHHTFAWRGLVIPGRWVRNKEKVTAKQIWAIDNMEERRAVIELVGADKIINDRDAVQISRDKYGILWEVDISAGGRVHEGVNTMRVVEVINGTPNPDGTKKKYYLPVDRSINTAHQGVAWSYGLSVSEYSPDVRT